MRVFISWSGDVSRQFAQALYDWLPKIIQSIDPWFSPEDIESGTVSTSEIRKILKEADYCIICLTPENQDRPWVNYEAGAIANQMKDSVRVCPVLIDLKRVQVKGPLSEYQSRLLTEDDIFKLIQTINNHIEKPLENEQLQESFDVRWDKLKEKFDAIERNYNTKKEPPDLNKMVEEMLEKVRDLHKRDNEKTFSSMEEVLQKELEQANREKERAKFEALKDINKILSENDRRIHSINKSIYSELEKPRSEDTSDKLNSLEKQLESEKKLKAIFLRQRDKINE